MISDYSYYLDEIQEYFPDVSKDDIKKILHHGFKMFYYINVSGGDVIIKKTKDNPILAYCGELQKDPLERNKYFTKKWHIKEKLKHFINKKEYKGFYYFGLSKEDGDKLLKQLKRKNKTVTLYNTIFRQSKNDVTFDTHLYYIFKLAYPLDVGFSFYKDKLIYLKEYINYVGINEKNVWNKQIIHSQKD